MENQLFVVGVFVCIISGLAILECYRRFKLKQKITRQWASLPTYHPLDREESLKKAWQKMKEYRSYDSEVDDNTWQDLAGFSLFEQMNVAYSSVGSQALYQKLRTFNFSNQNHETLEAMITFFDEHPENREKIQYYFACLGKKDHNHVESYLNNTRNQMLPNTNLIYVCGLLPIFYFLFLIFFPSTLAIVCLMSSVLFNVLFYLAKKEQLAQELVCMGYLVQTIACGKKISKIKNPMQKTLQQNLKPIESITKFGLSFRVKTGSEADLLLDYIAMIFMLPFISYNFVLKKLENYNQEAKETWHLLGEIEVAITVLNFRKCMPDTSQPIFSDQFFVLGKEVYHPLLETPVENPVDWSKNMLITGSNASGKSTYVRSVAISCLLSLTIHTALAKKFQLPFAHVMTSMAVADDIFAGDSYFIAEIKSLKRILQVIDKGQPCLCFIDEILKGTNTVERIAASTSVATWLNQQQKTLSFIATHDIELTEILADKWQNVHFEEQVTKEYGITFDYQLKEGAAKSKNAIRLLDFLNYPTEIVQIAQQMAQYFEKNHHW